MKELLKDFFNILLVVLFICVSSIMLAYIETGKLTFYMFKRLLGYVPYLTIGYIFVYYLYKYNVKDNK